MAISQNKLENIRQRQIAADKAREAATIKAAQKDVGEQYAHFLTMMPNTKKYRLIGAKDWKNVIEDILFTPYLEAKGAVRMALDEHRKVNAKLSITTEIYSIEASDENGNVITKPMVKAVIDSDIYGKTTGHKEIQKLSYGAKSSNPYEVAETQAIGRALIFMGYGLFADSEEVPEEAIPDTKNLEAEVPTDNLETESTNATNDEPIDDDDDDIPEIGERPPGEANTPTHAVIDESMKEEVDKLLIKIGMPEKGAPYVTQHLLETFTKNREDKQLYLKDAMDLISMLQPFYDVNSDIVRMIDANMFSQMVLGMKNGLNLANDDVRQMVSSKFGVNRKIADLTATEQRDLFHMMAEY